MNDDRSMLNTRWARALQFDAQGTPLLAPSFVAEQGGSVHLVDIRDPPEAEGPLGAIPGSVFIGEKRLSSLAAQLKDVGPIVVISRDGHEVGAVVRRLKAAGVEQAAAMGGGISAWRAAGLGITRKSAKLADGLQRMATPTAQEKAPLSLKKVEEHLGAPCSVQWTKLANLVSRERFSCVDGRDARGVIGTPGGEAGEFVLMLTALERVADTKWNDDTVLKALVAHLDSFGAFHVHTDRHAFDAMVQGIKNDPALKAATSKLQGVEDWISFLLRPGAENEKALLVHVVNPDYIGCGHLRLMLLHSDDYAVRRETVESFIRSFYRLLWAGVSDLHTSLLPGAHREGAVLNVQIEEKLWGLSQIPMISPACAGTQMFINHPQVSAFLRQAVTEFHARGLGGIQLNEAQVEKLGESLQELAALHMGKTLGFLASGLPVFTATFGRSGNLNVQASGHIASN